jgi:hypothetical protein
MTSDQQLAIIESMLTAGHRSVDLDRHSLLLWGLGGGALAAFTELVITQERFPDLQHRAFALLIWLAFWVGSFAWTDHQLTRHFRAARDETLPFAQAQINRAWCMLLGLAILGTFAMFFFGGGMMIYAMWMVLLGMGIYLYGLFSRPLIEWIGLATLLLGVTSLAAGVPLGVSHWLVASCFSIGLPLAGILASHIDDHRIVGRICGLGIWLALVILPAIGIFRLTSAEQAPSAFTISLSELGKAGVFVEPRIVHIPAGTIVPLKVDMKSSLIAISPDVSLPIQLTQPIDVLLDNGQPEGRYRFGDGNWHAMRDGVLALRIATFTPHIENGRPIIKATASMDLQRIDR